ncbi:hypothetical protein F4801DRAFT_531333 [Xylaria longipes]|nr:hypothetical protein F4801DRAFT_531333 [Xylaria longipes]
MPSLSLSLSLSLFLGVREIRPVIDVVGWVMAVREPMPCRLVSISEGSKQQHISEGWLSYLPPRRQCIASTPALIPKLHSVRWCAWL